MHSVTDAAMDSFVETLYGAEAPAAEVPAAEEEASAAAEQAEVAVQAKTTVQAKVTTQSETKPSVSATTAPPPSSPAPALLPARLKWCRPVRRQGRWQFFVELGFILLLFPAVVLGEMWLGARYTLALSMLVIACGVVLFLFLFDTRRPNPRELVVIASLIALGVAGRSVFFMLPQFKPLAALVIISGVSLGQETGFIVGSLTVLVSNIFLGQGPWTPWQMLAFGLIGFVAGALHSARIVPAYRWTLCVFGFFSIFLIYGLIMNPASLLMYSAEITPMSLLAVFVSGAPMDLVHAISTVGFLLVLSRPFLEKLERLKVKYGLK